MTGLIKKIISNKHRLNVIISNRLRIIISKFLKVLRPSSAPYISGDTFMNISDHVFNIDTKNFATNNIKKGDKVFVQLDVVEDWLKNFHDRINVRYVLISHNGDDEIGEKFLSYLDGDSKIIKWFSQNVNAVHENLVPIPIGLENISYYNNGLPSNFKKYENNRPSLNKIIYGFNIKTNLMERQVANNSLLKNSLAEKITGKWPGPKKYLDTISKYKFIASPPGNGIDCIRTWEAMYLRVVPIVKSSILTRYFKSIGLPLMIINDWDELLDFDEGDLSKKYEDIINNADFGRLCFNYWQDKINQIKE